jgi:hypothetical protein
MINLQARILVNIALGRGLANTEFPYENEDGSITKQTLGANIEALLRDTLEKFKQPHNFLLKPLLAYAVTSADRRYLRNIERERGVLRKLISDRKQGLTSSFKEGSADLISILLKSEMFKDDDEKIIDEVIMMF